MSKSEVLNKTMRLRITDLEYENLENKTFESEIKRIFLEESGMEIDVDFKVISTKDIYHPALKNSGYDGTAIQFYSEKKGINEIYIISRGTTDFEDWSYNARSLFGGGRPVQVDAAVAFTGVAQEEFKKMYNYDEKPQLIGLSHSLGNNTNAVATLVHETFDEVYSTQGAQPNVYQLFFYDNIFRAEFTREFSLKPWNANRVYQVPEKDATEFATNYYAEKGQKINQVLSYDDPLYAFGQVGGFFEIGNIEYIDTNPNREGLKELVEDIPEDILMDFHMFAKRYASSHSKNNGDHRKIIKDLTGFDLKVLKSINLNVVTHTGSALVGYRTGKMLIDMKNKWPELKILLSPILENRDVILDSLKNGGYLTDDEHRTLNGHLNSISRGLDLIVEVDFKSSMELTRIIIGLRDEFIELFDFYEKTLDPLLKEIVHSHSIEEMLNALNKENGKSYVGDAMLVTANQDGKEIVVNITDAVQMFLQGEAVLQEKKTEVEKLQTVYMIQIEDAYKYETRKLIDVIYHMEENPAQYAYSILRKHVPFSRNQIMLKEIKVHETLEPLQGVSFTDVYDQLMVSITRAEEFLSSSRTALEQIFEEDEVVSGIFKHSLPERGTQ